MTVNHLEVFKILKPFTSKRKILPLLIFGFDVLLFSSTFCFGLTTDSILLKIALGVLQGVFIVFLFVIGHDCCHGSFTSSKRLNALLGRIAFLPSLHNFRLWDLGHNKTHHAFTNYKSVDYVYTPLSPSEYLSLNDFQKMKYRVYRTGWGHGLYYGIEIWFKKMICPHSKIPNFPNAKKAQYLRDSFPLILYFFGLLIVIGYFSNQLDQSFLLNFLTTFLLPFYVWNWLMGFAIFQHHTNPTIKWFADKSEWNYWESQIDHSPHIRFPKPINFMLHNIMEHTAHHGNMNIPLYNLANAQTEIEAHFTNRIQVIDWNFAFYFDAIRKCKLYDYAEHKWLTFNEVEGDYS